MSTAPISTIPFSAIESIPQAIRDFLEGKLADYRPQQFSHENFERQIADKEASFSSAARAVLCEVLEEQMRSLPLSQAQKHHLSWLKDGNTFTVTTGHQLNLFTGPVFFIYKIIQTIATARYLQLKFPDKKFVPLFWMATEDHDFEEINHFKIPGHYFEIQAQSGPPVGRIIPDSVPFLAELQETFADTTYGTELIRWAQESYTAAHTLTEATRVLVNRIFGAEGLLVLDGDEARLKKAVQPVFMDELLTQSLQKETQKTVQELDSRYGRVQVNPRAVNLFYIKDRRERIDRNGPGFILSESGRTFTADEICAELAANPENFSPNALMRPVYQETVLPNVAYIGGNAEILYWFELRDYFKAKKLPYPVLVPRNSMLFITEKTLGKIAKTGLTVNDFTGNFAEMINRRLLSGSALSPLIDEKESLLKQSFQDLTEKAVLTDRTFANLLKAEETRQLKSYARMRKRLLRAERIRNQQELAHLQALFMEVHPGGIWQERVYNFSTFYAEEGPAWLKRCCDAINPAESSLIVMAM